MRRSYKILCIVLLVVVVVSVAIVPCCAIAYPDPTGEVGFDYYEPLRAYKMKNDTSSALWVIDDYWGDFTGDHRVSVETADGFYSEIESNVAGSSTKKLKLTATEDTWFYHDRDIILYFDDITVIQMPVSIKPTPINDLYLMYEDTWHDVFFSVEFDVKYYSVITQDDGTSFWGLTDAHISNAFSVTPTGYSGGGTVAKLHDKLNACINQAIDVDLKLTSPAGLGYIPYSITNMVVKTEIVGQPGEVEDGWESEARGVITTARKKGYNNSNQYTEGALFMPTLSNPNNDTNGSYDEGFADGYTTGYNDGNSIGYDEGYYKGYADGTSAGADEAYKSGYDDGLVVGTNAGYDAGYKIGADEQWDKNNQWSAINAGILEGKELGFEEGYEDGFIDGRAEGAEIPSDAGSFLVQSIGSFLDAEIFGTITMGQILLICVTPCLVLFFLRVFAR